MTADITPENVARVVNQYRTVGLRREDVDTLEKWNALVRAESELIAALEGEKT